MDPLQLAGILNAPLRRCLPFAPLLTDAFALFGIDTPQRQACFIAQIGHETGLLRYTRELWGPTKQQLRYEAGTTLARTLGNVAPGDGKRFMGRGCIQTTGRGNYRRLTQRLRMRFPDCPDFVIQPEQLERPFWAVIAAADYWAMRNLNRYADAFDFAGLTRKINGGYTGLAERQALYARAYASLT